MRSEQICPSTFFIRGQMNGLMHSLKRSESLVGYQLTAGEWGQGSSRSWTKTFNRPCVDVDRDRSQPTIVTFDSGRMGRISPI
jgi:hypothetical protein